MEASILASTHLLTDVLIFGDGRNYPGVLLLLSDQNSEDAIATVWPMIERLNKDTQNHARISKSMVLVAEPKGQPGLEKSSKGTILRRQAEARFATQIEQAYSQPEEREISSTASYDEVHSAITDCFAKVLGRDIDVERDLYGQGVDSISCIQIRGMIQNSCLPNSARRLPLNILYDKATVSSLVSYIWNLRESLSNGDSSEATLANGQNDSDKHLQIMRNLAAKYTVPLQWSQEHDSTFCEVVVLTGSTGFLGSHILRLLLADDQVRSLICLVRASSKEQAHSRIETTLRSRGHKGSLDHRIVCAPCDLNQKDLGLSPDLRELLATKATLFIHSAWTVNFSLHISSFEDQIRGTANMLNAAAGSGARMVFISSTAAVSESRHALISESISLDPKDASPLGYSQSKWVAEQICAAATDRDGPSDASSRRDAVVIIRVGQLCGDERGAWNETEAYPLMLSTAKIIGSLPSITGEGVNWLPVHSAARAVLDIAAHAGLGGSLDKNSMFHVLNHHNTPRWDQMLHWLQEDNNRNGICPPFNIVPASQWVSALEDGAQKEGKRHPAYALLGLWKNAFGSRDSISKEPPAMPSRFDNSRSQQVSSVMSSLQPLDQEQLVRMWRWVNQTLP
jgi:thioester reductase-like protein